MLSASATRPADADERQPLVPSRNREEVTYGSAVDSPYFESGGDSNTDNAGVDAGVVDNRNEEGNNSPDAASDAPEDGPPDGSIGSLTRRLRCVFSTITWPIVPLGTVVALALLWVLYAASSIDVQRCSHPLHWYALASLALVIYVPNHSLVRSRIFHYSRDRDGPIRPTRVRMYDQLFHTVSLLYVYGGISLMQTCRNDLVDGEDDGASEPLNTCADTCPNLYQALSVYVATLEMFTFALVLPLLFLPVIYLWFLRRATAEAGSFAQIQEQHDAIMNTGGITAAEILESLESVKLVSRTSENEESGDDQDIWLLSSSPSTSSAVSSTPLNGSVKECCICMTDFPIEKEADLENGEPPQCLPVASGEDEDVDFSGVVRTRCGHLFHKECLSNWVGGRWRLSQQSNNEPGNNNWRQAKQTCCPLCREDLRP